MNLNYQINEVSFASLGLHVDDSDGVLPGLSLKDPLVVNWPDMHGQAVDLSRPRYEARTIELSCFLLASSADDFLTKYNALITELIKPGTQRLQCTPVTGKPLVYEVYQKEAPKVQKKWRDTQMVGKFTLTLIEPQPVKWVLYNTAASVTLILTTPSPITVAWGDGTFTTLLGLAATATHTYANNSARYYIIVAGQLEAMNVNSQTNLTELWNRLY